MAIPMKRGRPSNASRPAKKAKVSHGKAVPPKLAKKVGDIKSTLMRVEALSDSTKKMLCVGLIDCFTVGTDDRHPIQTRVVEWVGEALASYERKLEENLAASQATLGSAESEKQALEKAKDDAENELAEKGKAVVEEKGNVKEAEANIKAAEIAQKDAESAQKHGDSDLISVEKKDAMIKQIREELFVPLKDGVEPFSVKLAKQIVRAGEDCDFDAAMLKSLPDVLSRPAAERGTFDTMVIDQFEDEYRKATEGFNMAIRSGTPAKDERAEKVSSAKAVLTQAFDKATEAKNRLIAAQEQYKAAEANLQAAQSEMKQFEKSNMDKIHAVDADTKALGSLRKGACAFYKDLKDWDGKPPAKKNA
jgi:hypothetical protein